MFSIFRPEPDIFGNDREKDLERVTVSNKKSFMSGAKFAVKDEESYDKYLEVRKRFEKGGEYSFAVKEVNGKMLNFFYDNISADLRKKIYIIDRALIKESVGSLEDMQRFVFGKKFFEGNLVLISGLGDRFSKVNKYSILLELISISYMNDISKNKRYSLFKRLCELNEKYLKWKGMNYRDFI